MRDMTIIVSPSNKMVAAHCTHLTLGGGEAAEHQHNDQIDKVTVRIGPSSAYAQITQTIA
jgi:hypothetical protein